MRRDVWSSRSLHRELLGSDHASTTGVRKSTPSSYNGGTINEMLFPRASTPRWLHISARSLLILKVCSKSPPSLLLPRECKPSALGRCSHSMYFECLNHCEKNKLNLFQSFTICCKIRSLRLDTAFGLLNALNNGWRKSDRLDPTVLFSWRRAHYAFLTAFWHRSIQITGPPMICAGCLIHQHQFRFPIAIWFAASAKTRNE